MGIKMGGLTNEQYHGQIVGKIGYIAGCMRNIDPENNLKKIREDYQDVLIWTEKNYRFEEILEASKSGKCPNDLDVLSRRSLVLQELQRLVLLISPFKMKFDLIESQYEKMKNHVDLWKSDYYITFNQLNRLTDYIKNDTATPKNYFLKAITYALKMKIAQYGITEENVEINELFKLGLNLLEIGNDKIDDQYRLFREYIKGQSEESPFERILTLEDQKNLVQSLINYYTPKLANKTLQDRLSLLLESGSLTKSLFDSIDCLINEDKELQAISTFKSGELSLDVKEIEEIYSEALELHPETALQYTVQQRDARLLCKAFPHSQEYITDSIAKKEITNFSDILHSKEFLSKLIEAEVAKKIDPQDQLQIQAVSELSQLLGRSMDKQIPHLAKMNIGQIQEYINNKTKSILGKIPGRIKLLNFMGFGIPTFDTIDNIINRLSKSDEDKAANTIILEFYQNIKQVKNQFFGNKLIEDITPENIKGFFDQCCLYGNEAAAKLSNNRPMLTKVVDILRALALWTIRLIGISSPPQFLKPVQTGVDLVSDAITEIKDNLEKTVERLQVEQEETLSFQ